MDFSNVKSLTMGEPYDAEVEYLEFTGSQAVPVPNTGDYFDIDLQVTGGASQTVFGNGTATRNRKFGTDASGYYAAIGNTSSQSSPVLGSVRKTVTVYVPRNAGITITVYVDGVAYKGETNRGSSWSNITIGGNSTIGFGSFRLYGLQGYKLVRVGTTGCLYNPETRDFIYPGTGTLVCGPDTRVVHRQEPVAILDSLGRILWKKDTTLKTINLNGLSIPGFNCSLTGLTACSICFWARNLADLYHCPSWAESGSWGGTYVGVNGSTIEARFGTGNSNSKKQWTYTQPANEWHHFAAVRNGTTGYYYLYIDGVLVSSQTGGTLAMTNSSSTFMLAQGFNGSTVNTDESIVAYCVFSKALTAAEVIAVKNSIIIDTSKAPFNSNLLLGLNLTEGSGNVLHNVADGSTVTIGTTPTWNVDFPPSQAFSFVEYLESTGTQYIDTGTTFDSSKDEVRVSYQLVGTTSYRYSFGVMQSGAYFGVGRDNSNAYLLYSSSATSKALSFVTANRHEAVANSNGLSIDNTSMFSYSSFASTASIHLFNLNRPGYSNDYRSATKLWGYKHWRNGVLIQDFQPCRLNGVGYMFDKVSRTFFGNAGTGEFLYGADI